MANIDTLRTILSNDLVAKWVNLRDYALDTLYSKSDIANLMDEIDKYGYGEWVENNGTWGPKGNVPIMTASNAPYGNAFASTVYQDSSTYAAFRAFDGNESTMYLGKAPESDTTPYIGYTFINPVKLKKIHYHIGNKPINSGVIEGSNDNFSTIQFTQNISNITANSIGDIDVNCNDYCMSYRIKCLSGDGSHYSFYTLQFYGRELKPLVPVMSADNAPKGEVVYSSQYNNTDYAGYKAFGDESQTKAWLPTARDANPYIGYKGNAPFNIKMFGGRGVSPATNRNTITWKIYGSDTGDANDWHDLNQTFVFCPYITSKQFEELTMNGSYKCYKLEHVSHTTDGLTVGSGNMFYFYGMDYSEKEFAPNSNRLEIYDHGVELEELDFIALGNGIGIKESDQLYGKLTSGAASGYYFPTKNTIDFGNGNYSRLNAYNGNKIGLAESTSNNGAIAINATKSGFTVDGAASRKVMTMANVVSEFPVNLDVSSISGNQYVIFFDYSGDSNRYGSCKEIWLE